MEDAYDYTGFAIKNILHPIIWAIEEEQNTPPEKKKKLKEKAFESFLEESKRYKECPGFQRMTVKQLQEEYEKFMDIESKEER